MYHSSGALQYLWKRTDCAGEVRGFKWFARHTRKRCCGLDRFSSWMALSSPEVNPASTPWQPQIPFPRSFFHDGANQERGSKHELIADFTDSQVVGELHWKRAHNCAALTCNIPCLRIDIRQKPIPKRVVEPKILLDLGAVLPHLRFGLISVNAKDRAKGAELKPSDEQFVVLRRCVLVDWTEEATDVCCPIGKSGDRSEEHTSE